MGMSKNLNQILHYISTITSYMILITTQLKLAFECLLHRSFAHSYNLGGAAPGDYFLNNNNTNVRYYEQEDPSSPGVECSVCLNEIQEGDEVRELSCDHLFHRECLDRWLAYGNTTCPLCRSCVKMPRLFFPPELHHHHHHQQVLLYNDVYGIGSSPPPVDNNSWLVR